VGSPCASCILCKVAMSVLMPYICCWAAVCSKMYHESKQKILSRDHQGEYLAYAMSPLDNAMKWCKEPDLKLYFSRAAKWRLCCWTWLSRMHPFSTSSSSLHIHMLLLVLRLRWPLFPHLQPTSRMGSASYAPRAWRGCPHRPNFPNC